MAGKFIVIYGINNIGKTTQAKLLKERMDKEGFLTEYIKYPRYELKPAGELINNYLREGNEYNFSPREFQLLHYIDRVSYEPILKEKLKQEINIVAEDYFGTGLAWGIGSGVNKELLESFYNSLHKEDIAILLEGKRFHNCREETHKHECNDELLDKVSLIHSQLADKHGWIKVKANRSVEEVHDEIWEIVSKLIYDL